MKGDHHGTTISITNGWKPRRLELEGKTWEPSWPPVTWLHARGPERPSCDEASCLRHHVGLKGHRHRKAVTAASFDWVCLQIYVYIYYTYRLRRVCRCIPGIPCSSATDTWSITGLYTGNLAYENTTQNQSFFVVSKARSNPNLEDTGMEVKLVVFTVNMRQFNIFSLNVIILVSFSVPCILCLVKSSEKYKPLI
jgi:hypothetical protein